MLCWVAALSVLSLEDLLASPLACTESQLWQGTDSCKCEQEYQISHTSTRHLLSKGFIQLQATPDPVITSLILKVCNSLWFTSYLAFKPRCDSTFAQTESLSESQSLSLGCKSRANQILVPTQLRWITVRGEQNNSWTPPSSSDWPRWKSVDFYCNHDYLLMPPFINSIIKTMQHYS